MIVYCGICLDNKEDTLWMASFDIDLEEVKNSCNRQFPSMPVFTFQLMEPVGMMKARFYSFLDQNGVPPCKQKRLLEIVASELRELIKTIRKE